VVFASGVILIKTALDIGITVAFAVMGKWPMAVMFAGFAIADFGAYLVTP